MSSDHQSPKIAPYNTDLVSMARSINMLADGRSDAYAATSWPLTLSTTRTEFTDAVFEQVAQDSVITVSPRNEAAAGAKIWIQSKANSSFTLGHDSTTATMLVDLAWKG